MVLESFLKESKRLLKVLKLCCLCVVCSQFFCDKHIIYVYSYTTEYCI